MGTMHQTPTELMHTCVSELIFYNSRTFVFLSTPVRGWYRVEAKAFIISIFYCPQLTFFHHLVWYFVCAWTPNCGAVLRTGRSLKWADKKLGAVCFKISTASPFNKIKHHRWRFYGISKNNFWGRHFLRHFNCTFIGCCIRCYFLWARA